MYFLHFFIEVEIFSKCYFPLIMWNLFDVLPNLFAIESYSSPYYCNLFNTTRY